jgi:hypothetical protein
MAINIENRRVTVKLDKVGLEVGDQIAHFVDSKLPNEAPIFVSLKLRGGSEGPDDDCLIVSGTQTQVEAVEHILDLRQQAVADSLYLPPLREALTKGTLFSADHKTA